MEEHAEQDKQSPRAKQICDFEGGLHREKSRVPDMGGNGVKKNRVQELKKTCYFEGGGLWGLCFFFRLWGLKKTCDFEGGSS